MDFVSELKALGNAFRVVAGTAVTLIDSKHPQKFFERDYIYDYEDDFERWDYHLWNMQSGFFYPLRELI